MNGPVKIVYTKPEERSDVIYVKSSTYNKEGAAVAVPIMIKDKYYHEGVLECSFLI